MLLVSVAAHHTESAGKHQYAVLDEGAVAEPNVPLGCGHNLRPDIRGLLSSQLKHELVSKASDLSGDLFVEAFGRYSVELGQLGVEHDLPAADEVDTALDELRRK